ncbi:MAG: DNA-binding protein [Alphaproteobacteria bacterium]|nr:DNA-binding protein [Alphaproteobacteria bacterium]
MSKSQAIISAGAPEGARALRINEFCQRYRVGRTRTYALIVEGKIKSVTIAGRRLIPTDEAERILREGV